MAEEANKGSVEVKIFDQTYHLHGDDPEYIRELAEHVEEEMRDLAERHKTGDRGLLGVMAAVRIAHQYHFLRDQVEAERKATPNPQETAADSDSKHIAIIPANGKIPPGTKLFDEWETA